MSSFDQDLFDQQLFDDQGGSLPVLLSLLSITVDGVDVTSRLLLGNEIASRLTADQTQDGTTGQVWLNYSDLAPLPAIGARFVFTFVGGNTIVLQARTISKVAERYHDPSVPLWIHEFDLIDPLSALNNQKLPNLRPMVNTTTGAIFAAVIAAMDSTLDLDLAAGSTVGAVNFHEFSLFGDLRRSEIVGAGYVLRMNGGLNVRGALDTGFTANSDWRIDKTDPRYTPSRFHIDPPNEIFTSVEVVPQKEVPLYRVAEVHELDGRVMPGVGLEAKPFGLEDSEPFKLAAGADISDTDLWEQTGSIGMSGSHILLNGSLTNLDARPYVFPFMISWVGIIPDSGTGYQFGFKDGNGNWIWSVGSGDYPLTLSAGDDQHTYEIFTLPKAGGSIEIWGFHLHQNFNVDDTVVITTVVSVDYATNTVVLAAPWAIDNTYIRFIAKDHIPPHLEDGTERGRTRILRRSGSTLVCDALPPGIEAGDPVTRGVAADSVITITHIKDVGAVGGYGLPAISGSGVHLQEFIIQRTGQIEGYLLSEYNSMPDQIYPRALRLDVDATEFSDGVVTGSGSSASVNFSRKFSTERRLMVALNYVVGGKKKFPHQCGSGGGHLVVPIANEQDPAVLAAIAARLCAISSTNNPRVTSAMESPLIAGIPLPFDPLPLNVNTPYRVSVPSVPILSSKFTLMGWSNYYQQEVLLWDIDAGDKSPAERAQEEALRGTVLAKYPIRVASIGGVRVNNVSWNDVTLSASISGGGTVYGPKGQAINLGGCDPAAEAGIADPNAAPITLRCTTDAGNLHPDVIVFQLIYPPKPVIQESVTCHYNARTNLITFHINRPSGALAFDIQRKLDPDGDGTYEFTNIARQVSNDVVLPYEPNSKSIKVRSVGLCDKVSGAYVEIDCVLPALPAPTLFSLVKIKGNGVAILRVSPPPTGRDITGRTKLLRVWVRQTTDSGLVVDSRDDFPANDDSVVHHEFTPPPEALTLTSPTNWRVHVPFDDTDADDIVWVAACWVDGFDDEGAITVPFDATNPPVTPGSISLVDFFQTAAQSLGGTVEDDNDETAQVEFTGIFRYHLGQNNTQVRAKFEESLPDPAHGYATGVWPSEGGVFHQVGDVSDEDVVNGYIDIEFKQYFRWGKKKHRTYRPTKIVYIGPKIRERGVANDQATRETVYLVGYDSTVESAPAIVPYQVDAVYDKSLFQFHPGIAGLANNLATVGLGRIDQLDNGFVYHWPRLDGVEVRRYVLLIHTAPFGTRGPGTPGTDPNLLGDLNALVDQGQVRVYNVANTVFGTVVQAVDLGDVKKLRFDNGADVIGSITVTAGVPYYVTVIAQTFNGRWSTNFSAVLNTTSGAPVAGGDAGPPGPILNLNWVWKEAVGYKVGFDHPSVNATSIQYYWAVVYNDTAGIVYMNPETGAAMAGGTTEAQARFQIAGRDFIRVRRATMDALFVASGARIKVWAVNVVDAVPTEALVGDRVTSALLIPGSDAGGPAIDGGPPDIPTANLKFKGGNLIAKFFSTGAANWESVYDIELALFYPSNANGTTTARTFFDPDTGADTGVWSNALQTATFGVGGNSGFFTGGRAKFIGKVTKATLPTGALTGGIGIVARGYNKTQGSTGPVATTNPSTSAGFATGAALHTLALGSTDTDFANDRDAANWVNSGAAATVIQAGLSLIITKKVIWLKYDQPTHLQSAPDDIPHPVKYGYKLRAGNDSNNWLDPKNPATPITVDANSEFFTASLEDSLGTMRSDMAAVFQTNGLKLAVRAWVYVNGILTPGPFTQYTAAVPVSGDPTAADTTAPTGLNIPAVKAKKHGIAVHGMYATGQNEGIQYTEVSYYVTNAAGTILIGHIDPATNTLSGSQIFRNIGTSGQDLLVITKAQLIAAFGLADRAIAVQYKMTNLIGTTSLPTSLLSPTQTVFLPFSSLVGDDVTSDTAVPTSLTTPLLSNQPEVLKAQNMHADANNNEWITNLIVFKVVDNAGVLVNYINTATNTATGSEATAQIDAKSGHYNLRITALQLAAAFGGPSNRNVRVYFYVRNPIGTSLKSPDSLSIPFSSIGTDLVSQDTGVPSGLATPTLHAKRGAVLVKGIRPTVSINQLRYNEIVVKCVDDAGALINYLDLATNAVSGTEQRFNIGGSGHFELRFTQSQLIALFGGPTNRNLRVYYFSTNVLGTSASPSADSASLAFSALSNDTAEDAAAAGQVVALTLVWKEKVGYKALWQPPATNNNSIRGYWVVYFNDTSGTVYMDPRTGQQAAVQTEVGARIFVPDTHHSTHLKSTDLVSPFSATGIKTKVYAQNTVNGVLTDGASVITSPLVVAGSDTVGTGVVVDSGPPDPPTVTAVWKASKGTKVSLVQSGVNVTSLRDYGVAFFHPANATGLAGSRRNFFNPNTGAATGVWEATVSTTASFGRSGNSEFFIGNSKSFSGHALKADLPTGAITGGIGILARAFNYTNAITPIETPSTSDVNFPLLSVAGAGGTSISSASITGDFASDRDAANWVNSGAAATPAQAGMSVKITTKMIKCKWDPPTHLASAPDDTPRAIYKYGFKLRAGDDSNNWLDINTPGIPITVDANSEFFVGEDQAPLELLRASLAVVFQTNGLKLAVRPYSYVNGASLAGPFTQYTLASAIGADPQAEDTAASGVVQNLTVVWKEKVGYKSRWQPPITGGLNSILGYWVVYFNDTSGTVYMDPATGQAALVQTEVGTRIFVPDTHHSTHLKSTEFVAPFSTSGVKVKVYAQNVVNGVKTDGASSTTTPLVAVGSDVVGTGVVVDSGPANNPAVTALWKPAKGIKIKLVQDTVNVTTLHDYGLAFFYPSSATGQSGSRRNFFNPDTGVDTGVWEASVSTTATFGRGGNSEFFFGNNKSFSPGAGRADLPSGAVTGGVGILARAYNYTNIVSPAETASTSNAAFPILTGAGLGTVSIASDFSDDRDAANWVNSASQATAVQAGLSLIITKKTAWLKWDQPIHLQSVPDGLPRGIFRYGYKLQAGNGSSNWLDPKVPGTPITVDANAEFFTDSLETSLGTMRADMAAVFQTNGLKLAVRAWTYVGGVATPGPFTQYTAAVPVSGDPTAADTTAPTGLQTPNVEPKKNGIKVTGMYATAQDEQHQFTEISYYVTNAAGTVLIGYVDPATNGLSGSQIWRNISKAGSDFLAITRAQLLAAFGGDPTVRALAVQYRITNLIGPTAFPTSLLSPTQTVFLQFTSLITDDVVKDLLVPSGLTTPTLTNQPEFLRASGMHADANNNEWITNLIVFKVVDDVGTLVNYINPATNGATANEAIAQIDAKSGHYNLRITASQLATAFGGPTNRNVRVYFYARNPIGPSLKSPDSVSLPFSALGTDLVSQDVGVPSSLQTPTLIAKRDGLLAKGIRATANNNVMLYDELVIKVVDNAGVLVTAGGLSGYIDPTSVSGAANAANEGAAKLQVADGQAHFHKVRKDDLIAVWGGPANRNLRCYYYATNEKGTNATPSADSASLAFGSLGADSLGVDLAVPSGLTQPTIHTQRGAFVVKGIRPTVDVNTLLFNELVIKIVDDSNVLVNYLDLTNNTASASEQKFNIGGSGHFSVRITQSQLVALFGGVANRNIRAYYYSTNVVGSSSASADSVSKAFSTLSNDTAEDVGVAGPVVGLSLVWKEKVGYKATWQPPATNNNSVRGYWIVYFNDASGIVYMNPATGQQAAVQTEVGARLFVDNTYHATHLKSGDLVSPFSATGVKVKVYAQNVVNGALVDGATTITAPMVPPGSDVVGSGVVVDGGPANPPTVTAIWKASRGIKVKSVQDTVNVTSLHDYGLAFFHPAAATGLVGSRRNFFNPDTGAATGAYEQTVITTATFGRAGNSEFFAGNSKMFTGQALKADLPSVAITGGIGVLVRGYNYTNVVSPTETPSTSDASFPLLSIAAAGGASISSANITGDFASDRDAANWVNSASPATAIQAGLSLIITKKIIWLKWDPPVHLQSAPDDIPHPVKYGYKLRAGNDSNNWLDPKNPATPITVDANSEFFTASLEDSLGTMRSDMAAIFQTNGLKLAVRAYVYVNGTLTPGPFTQYTAAVSVSGDPLADPSAAPGDPLTTLVAPTAKFKDGLLVRFDVDSVSQLFGEWRAAFNLDDNAGNSYNFVTRAWESGAHYFDMGQTGVVHTNVRKADIFTTVPLRTSVRVYYKLTNAIGVTGSAITNVANIDAAEPPLDADGVVPTSLTTPTLTNQPEVLKAQNMHADANNTQHQYTEVVFKVVDNAGALVNYINPATNGATSIEATAKINVGKSGHYNLRITGAQLAAAFAGPSNRNVRVYFYATNTIGTSVKSPDSASLPFSSLLTDLVSQDVGVPSSLQTPNLLAKKDGMLAKGIRATANNNVMLYDELVIKVVDNSGTLVGYLDPVSVSGAASAANEAAAKLQVADGQAHFHKVRVDDLVSVWGGPSNRNLRCYYYSTNEKGTNATPSADSTSLAFASLGADSLGGDTAVVAAPGAPQVIPKSQSIKVKCPRPAGTINFNQFIKAEIVARVKDVGGSVLGYIQDAAGGPAFSGGEFKNDIGPNLKDLFNWSKTAVLALFTAPTTIEFYFYITNGFGSSTAGTPTVLTISTWSADGVFDAAVPSQPPAPGVKEQYGDVIVKAKPPLTGGNAITKWQVAITDANSTPTTTDTPTFTGGTFIVFEEGADGVQKFRIAYAASGTRYFWTRCKNASNPSVGGPGNNGWSDWSPFFAFSLNASTRPALDEVGTGAPTHSTAVGNNGPGYSDAAGTTQVGGSSVPVDVSDDTQDVIYELYLPTDQNAYSLRAVQYQQYKVNGVVLRGFATLHPDGLTTIRLPLFAGSDSTFRFRLRNKYRVGGSSGWSAWTLYTRYANGTRLYNPGVQVESDFLAEGSIPPRYTTP